jgi:hypothetical protein
MGSRALEAISQVQVVAYEFRLSFAIDTEGIGAVLAMVTSFVSMGASRAMQ